jgi:hypothetical protein
MINYGQQKQVNQVYYGINTYKFKNQQIILISENQPSGGEKIKNHPQNGAKERS